MEIMLQNIQLTDFKHMELYSHVVWYLPVYVEIEFDISGLTNFVVDNCTTVAVNI